MDKNKNELLTLVWQKTDNKNIRFPSQIAFSVENGTLNIGISSDATCNNMQTDGAAFEGWAICLKGLLPEIVSSVQLNWKRPEIRKDDSNKKLHYNRFLYRVLNFSELYEWFSISEMNTSEIEEFKRELTDLHNNSFSENPQIKGVDKGKFKLSETIVEFLLANDLSSSIRERFDLDFIDRQFPVGVKKGNLPFFTGGMSAIDLWGTKNDTLTIIELNPTLTLWT